MTEAIEQWFTEEDKNSRIFFPVQRLNHDRNNWSLSTLALLEDDDDDDAVSFTSIAKDPESLYKTQKIDFEKLIKELVHEDTDLLLQWKAANELKAAGNALRGLKADRQLTKSRKVGTVVQSTLTKISDFMKSFSGIAEIVKAADQQFGGLAYGTVSLLITVAMNKSMREEAFEEALEELAYAFSRLDSLQQLRKNDRMRLLIVEIFELVILFCREAITYFVQRLRRLTKAFSPLKLKTLQRLRTKLSEIQKECVVAALGELADVKEQLREMERRLRRMELTGDDTNDRMRESQASARKSMAQAKQSYMFDLRRLLGQDQLDDASSSDTVARYKSILVEISSDQRRKRRSALRSARQMSPELLTGEVVFSNWLESTKSLMLILGGSNWQENSSVSLNWLSYASVYAVESKLQSGCLLSFFCQTDYTVLKRKRRSFPDIIRSFIYQIVEQHPDYIQPRLEEISDALERSEWDDQIQIVAKQLEGFAEGTDVTIVIDRLDQCRWSDEREDERNRLMEAVGSLLELVEHPCLKHLCIKVLLVMDSSPAQRTTKLMDWARGRGMEWKTDWDQDEDDQ